LWAVPAARYFVRGDNSALDHPSPFVGFLDKLYVFWGEGYLIGSLIR